MSLDPSLSNTARPALLERLFHAWELRLASTTKDRVVRPFDWGLEWLPDGAEGIGAAVRVDRWVDEVMKDTDAFFHLPPTRDYAFAGRRAASGGGARAAR
jgi:hypothetical protein